MSWVWKLGLKHKDIMVLIIKIFTLIDIDNQTLPETKGSSNVCKNI